MSWVCSPEMSVGPRKHGSGAGARSRLPSLLRARAERPERTSLGGDVR